MWELMPSKIKYGLPIVLSIGLYLIFHELFKIPAVRSVSFTISAVTILAWVFGKYLWKYCYIGYFEKNFCPNFNGVWVAKVKSNYIENTYVQFELEIIADFFSIKMIGDTTIGRTYAKYCRVERADDGNFELLYMFKVMNDSPSKTDALFYEGAARLRVFKNDPMEMKGVFWTNRCWQNNMNTAGEITLTRKK